MSEQSAKPGGAPTPATATAEDQAEPGSAQVQVPGGRSPATPPPETPAGGEEDIMVAIDKLENEAAQARITKRGAEGKLADKENRLTALRALQREADATVETYRTAYEQLEREHRAYHDFYTSEKGSLETLLGSVVDEVKAKSTAAKDKGKGLESDVKSKAEALRVAEQQRDRAKAEIKPKADELNRYKKITATISARHAKLKSIRDEVLKARQAGQYALAYWLLAYREAPETLKDNPELITPDALPGALLNAVNALADAEMQLADQERRVAECGEDLANAKKRRDEHQATSEAALRAELEELQPAVATTRGDTDHA